jgi:hypothetical protein
MGRISAFYFLALAVLFGCDGRNQNVDLKCGAHSVAGERFANVAKLKIDGIARVLPLQGMFTDEYTAKYAPEYLSDPSLAMTVKNYVGLDPDNKKIDFIVYLRRSRVQYYELEIEGEKWQCR